MKLSLLLLFIILFIVPDLHAQLFASDQRQTTFSSQQSAKRDKTKAATYSSLGYNIPLGAKDIIVGGTTTVYRKFGTFIGYNVGIQNFLMPTNGERGDAAYSEVQKSGWTITGKTEQSAAFIFNGGLTVALAKRMPLYFGGGITRYREFFEYVDPTDNKTKWNANEKRTRLEINYAAGIFVPLFSRMVLNVGYNSNPQTVFVGITISGKYNFEDADDWWWGN
jgi:hypothetical protein